MESKVLVIDRERVFADAVAAHLEGEQDLKVVAAIRPGPHGELPIAGGGADVVLLDADLPGGAANSICEKLTGPREPARVIMLSDSSEPERIVAAIRAGASAWVRKDESVEHLLRVVRGTVRGETWLPPTEAGTVLRMLMWAQDQRQRADLLLSALTPREREILACCADGAGRRDVAERLNLSTNTVRTHLQNAMSKLGVHSTLEAVALTRWACADNLRCQRVIPMSVCNMTTAVRRPFGSAVIAVITALAVATTVAACGEASPSASPEPLVSWNKHVAARPVRATIHEIVGTTVNALGGPTRSGGWYAGVSLADQRHWVNKKVVSGADQKRMVPPPATWQGVPVFVEVDDVQAFWMDDNGGVPGTDQDTSANVCVVGQPRTNLTCIHIEIDGQWKARGWAPRDFPMRTPIDVQGYVYWDNPHESEGVPVNSAPSNYILGHYETGWEIHPVSAWRPHHG